MGVWEEEAEVGRRAGLMAQKAGLRILSNRLGLLLPQVPIKLVNPLLLVFPTATPADGLYGGQNMSSKMAKTTRIMVTDLSIRVWCHRSVAETHWHRQTSTTWSELALG